VAQDLFKVAWSMAWLSSVQYAVDGILMRPLDAHVTMCESRHLQVAKALLKMVWSATKLSPVQYAVDGMLMRPLEGYLNANVAKCESWHLQVVALIIDPVKESSKQVMYICQRTHSTLQKIT